MSIKKLLLSIFLIIVVIIGYMLYARPEIINIILNSTSNLNKSDDVNVSYDYIEYDELNYDTPKDIGYIYLTLTPFNTNKTNGYVYNIKENRLSNMNTEDQFSVLYDTNISTNERAYETTDTKGRPIIQIYNTKNKTSQTVVTLDTDIIESPIISNNGDKILYNILNDTATDKIPTPNDASIYLASKINKVWSHKMLTKGSSPAWVNNSSFFFLKDDGLYKGELEKASFREKRIKHITNTKLEISSRIDVSNDGRRLAWSFPALNKVVIYEIQNIDGRVNLKEVSIIKAVSYWSKFSPSGNNIALQVTTSELGNKQPQMRLYNIDKLGRTEIYRILNLFDYDQMSMFLTEWD